MVSEVGSMLVKFIFLYVRSKLYEAYSYPLTRSKESHQETKRQQTLLLLERLERQAVGSICLSRNILQ